MGAIVGRVGRHSYGNVLLDFLLTKVVAESYGILCYALVLPGRKSDFRAGFWPYDYRESTEMGRRCRHLPGSSPAQNSARKSDFWPGSIIA